MEVACIKHFESFIKASEISWFPMGNRVPSHHHMHRKPHVIQCALIGGRYITSMDTHCFPCIVRHTDRSSVFVQCAILVGGRESFQRCLSVAGVPTAGHYPIPLNELAACKNLCGVHETHIADAMAQQVISLPMGADLKIQDQASVASILTSNLSPVATIG
jgi:hypothetical protein